MNSKMMSSGGMMKSKMMASGGMMKSKMGASGGMKKKGYAAGGAVDMAGPEGKTMSQPVKKTVTGDTVFTQGLTATTISATTYLNLPVTADTNFANTNLTLNNDRIHDG